VTPWGENALYINFVQLCTLVEVTLDFLFVFQMLERKKKEESNWNHHLNLRFKFEFVMQKF